MVFIYLTFTLSFTDCLYRSNPTLLADSLKMMYHAPGGLATWVSRRHRCLESFYFAEDDAPGMRNLVRLQSTRLTWDCPPGARHRECPGRPPRAARSGQRCLAAGRTWSSRCCCRRGGTRSNPARGWWAAGALAGHTPPGVRVVRLNVRDNGGVSSAGWSHQLAQLMLLTLLIAGAFDCVLRFWNSLEISLMLSVL